MEKHCSKCNTVNTIEAKFCSNCGTVLSSTSIVEADESNLNQNTQLNKNQSLKKDNLNKFILIGIAILLSLVVGSYMIANINDTNYLNTVRGIQLTEYETLEESANRVLIREAGDKYKVEDIKWRIVEENKKGKLIEASIGKNLRVTAQIYQRKDRVYIDRGDVIFYKGTRPSILF